MLTGHTSASVQRQGWASIKNGKLLALAAAAEFDMLLTADKGMEYQQNLATLPVSILIMLAKSNRVEDLALVMPKVIGSADRDETSNLDQSCCVSHSQESL